MLYDGQCPLCSREVTWLQRRNLTGAVDFEDISDPLFDPAKYGLTMEQAIGAMHAVTPDGGVLKGVDVFVEVYQHCGLTWISKMLAFRPTRPAVNLLYRMFARVRPWFSRLDAAECRDRCAVRR